jgi:hypothetical protein
VGRGENTIKSSGEGREYNKEQWGGAENTIKNSTVKYRIHK